MSYQTHVIPDMGHSRYWSHQTRVTPDMPSYETQ